jgi:hypothetical protein
MDFAQMKMLFAPKFEADHPGHRVGSLDTYTW